jgi:hypothetical protein
MMDKLQKKTNKILSLQQSVARKNLELVTQAIKMENLKVSEGQYKSMIDKLLLGIQRQNQ